MELSVANASNTCTTLVLGEMFPHSTLATFKHALKIAVQEFDDEESDYHDYHYSVYDSTYRWDVEKHALVICTTVPNSEVVVGYLRELGFKEGLTAVASKTNNPVTLWSIPVADLLAALN